MTQTAPIPARPAQSISGGPLAAVHWTVFGLLLVLFGLAAAQLAFAAVPPGWTAWTDAALVVMATLSTLISLSRQLPVQNVLLASAIIGAGGTLVQAIGTLAAIPLGPSLYTRAAGPRFLNALPWWLPCLWVVTLLNSRGAARLILRPWRQSRAYGFWLFGLAVALGLLLDLGLESLAPGVKGYWIWNPLKSGLSWYGAPAAGLLGWTVTALFSLAIATPALINKRPPEASPQYHPLVLWVLLDLLFVTGATAHHLWLAALSGSGAVLIVAGFAVRGARG